MTFCFARTNSNAAVTLKTINNARAEFLGSTSLKRNRLITFAADLQMFFDLKYLSAL